MGRTLWLGSLLGALGLATPVVAGGLKEPAAKEQRACCKASEAKEAKDCCRGCCCCCCCKDIRQDAGKGCCR